MSAANKWIQFNRRAPWGCRRCAFRCHSKDILMQHAESAHPGTVHSCSECPYRTDRSTSYFERHMICHLKLSPHTCLRCGKCYSSAAKLDEHVRGFHLRALDFVCDICGNRYNYSAALRTHVRRTHERKSIPLEERRVYKCPECPYQSEWSESVSRHRSTAHVTEPRFECALCPTPTRFKLKTALNMHMRVVHLKCKPFTCQACGLNFPLQAYLNKHRKKRNH